jgi:RHS repeat-associated protein
MKKIIVIAIIITSWGSSIITYSQTTSKNFLMTERILIDAVYTTSAVNALSTSDKVTTIEYFDGIGRLIQTVQKGGSPMLHDIIQPIKYNSLGRQDTMFLPFTTDSGSGAFSLDPFNDVRDFYTDNTNSVVDDLYPFSVSYFDNSPLNRVVKQGAAGHSWQPDSGHVISVSYLNNNENEVPLWELNSTGDCIMDGYYPAGKLSVSKTVDENGNASKQYTDNQGNVILNKTNTLNDSLETYYVYDDFGLLRFVIPPLATQRIGANTTISQSISDSLMYYYKYDNRKRMVEKKLPGADSVYMIYDIRNRLVASQDGNLRDSDKWIFTKYDVLNRPILTGIWEDSGDNSRQSLQTLVNTKEGIYLYEIPGTDVHGYSNRTFPNESIGDNYLTVTYYDNYDFLDYTYQDYIAYTDSFPQHISESTYTLDKITGSKTKVLDESTWLTTSIYYDDYGRVIQSTTDNYLEGYDRITNEYDFVGNLLRSRHVHYGDGALSDSLVVWSDFEYDHAGRLLKEYKLIEGDAGNDRVLISLNEYNELGQMMTKNLHAVNSQETSFLQEVDYQYNIRGWLTKINDPTNISNSGDLFGLELMYDTINDLTMLSTGNQYNGNISAMKWKGAHFDTLMAYGFTYDNINRLTSGDMGYNVGAGWIDNTGYNLSSISYDKNGNILSLSRDGYSDQIDDLVYGYKGNQLIIVDDNASGTASNGFADGINTSADYTYDKNGNLTIDNNKGIDEIIYNYLNLPCKIISGLDTIYYYYDAAGIKLKKIVSSNGSKISEIDYIGGIIYTDSVLELIITSDGRIVHSGNGDFTYEYFLKDHLGNTRVSFWDSVGVAAINQEMNYYPFGMVLNRYDNSSDNKYLYNGKEIQDDQIGGTSLDWYDYGARFYDPQIGRWHVQDRFSENYYDLSIYQYGANNPVLMIDINGDSLNFSSAMATDPNAVKNVTNDVQTQTGLTLTVDPTSGQMTYATTTNKRGKKVAAVATDANGKKVGSRTARKMITKAIDNKNTVNVYATNKMGSMGGGLQININSTQINQLISGTSSNLDSKTMGFGMTFLHELGHTDLGGSEVDPQTFTTPSGAKAVNFGELGTNVPKMNRIRRQLGSSFGQRTSYGSMPIGGNTYLPFSTGAKSDLERGIVPANSYIKQ